MLLNADVAETFLPNLGEKLTLIAALAFFLYYFMKELKEVRTQMEESRKNYEKKLEDLFERVLKVEDTSQNTMDRLADSIDDLSSKLKNFKP